MSTMNAMERAVIALVKSAIDGSQAVLPTDTDWNALFSFGKQHKLIPLFCYAIETSGVPVPDSLMDAISDVVLRNIMYDQQQQFALQKVLQMFEENGIDYMPVKGIFMKTLYPQTEMRPMGDGDILIRLSQKDAAFALMEQMGYQFKVESANELVFIKDNICVELHKFLIPPYNKDYFAYYGDGWRLAQKTEGSAYRYELSANDHYIFIFTHFAKHYRDGGIGVLHMADLWIYAKRLSLDMQYIRTELAKLQLLEFYDNICKTIDVWFNDAAADEMTDFITHRIFNHGTWGTKETRNMAAAVKTAKTTTAKGVAAKRLRDAAFPGVSVMQKRYPILRKCKFLLPFCWGIRWFRILFFKRDRLHGEIEELRRTTEENITAYQDELNYVGLDFNFKE